MNLDMTCTICLARLSSSGGGSMSTGGIPSGGDHMLCWGVVPSTRFNEGLMGDSVPSWRCFLCDFLSKSWQYFQWWCIQADNMRSRNNWDCSTSLGTISSFLERGDYSGYCVRSTDENDRNCWLPWIHFQWQWQWLLQLLVICIWTVLSMLPLHVYLKWKSVGATLREYNQHVERTTDVNWKRQRMSTRWCV